MRSTKAFLIGAGTAYVLARLARGRAQRDVQEALKDVELSIDESGVATLRGSVPSSKQADELVAQVASLPGVNDVAAMLRVSERRAA
jgi:osmotically-inducible protein OsmY